MEREELKLQLKQHMIKYLNLLEITPQDIGDDQPLFGEGLGLDSIDALELSVLLEREYKIKINDPKEGKKIFVNVNTIVDYILQHSGQTVS
ncbi:MAG TPA: phosphopantetheine-binding protein [Bacteroidia bacterium]|nr:phosphopantetheine-binding protein [Bacteroidia bacterium]